LNVHLGQRQIDGLLRATAALQGTGLKLSRPHLGHLKGDFSHAGEHGLRLAAIGLVHMLGAELVGHGLQMLGAFETRGFVDQNAQGFAGTIKSVGK
jgi:hypothetical protein